MKLTFFCMGLLACGCKTSPVTPEAPAPQLIKNTANCQCFDYESVFNQIAPSVVSIGAGEIINGRFNARQVGSGFVWDAHNHVVTSAHVVTIAPTHRVRTAKGRVLKAELIAYDIDSDLAVLSVPQLNLSALPRGDASNLHPGQSIAAVGNPYGLDQSITIGVVSALGRSLPDGSTSYYGANANKAARSGFIQTDLAINPGNSGGPLLDRSGLVIGVNAATLDRGQGVSFAAPIDRVEVIVRALIEEGVFHRGYIGLYLKPVPPKTAAAAGLAEPTGARVKSVVAQSPAERIGLQEGDIILEFNGKKVTNESALPWLVASTTPGSQVDMLVARGKERLRLSVQVEQKPEHSRKPT